MNKIIVIVFSNSSRLNAKKLYRMIIQCNTDIHIQTGRDRERHTERRVERETFAQQVFYYLQTLIPTSRLQFMWPTLMRVFLTAISLLDVGQLTAKFG